jgi:outer membrane protein
VHNIHRSNRIRSTLATFAFPLALAGVFAASAVAAPGQAAAEVPQVRKIALIDMQRVLDETKQGKAARGELEASAKKKEEKLDKRRIKLETESGKLKDLQGAEAQALQEKLQRDYMELQSMYMTLQQELAEQEGKVLSKIYENSQDIVGDMAKAQGIDIVLIRDESTVIYAQDGFDITTDLIKAYDKQFSGKLAP